MATDPKSYETITGPGGELHQQTDAGGAHLTTNHGIVIADNQNSLKAGARGPTLLEDFILREKIFHFDHERIPERIVHARGTGAHGYFEPYAAAAQYSKAALFQNAGEQTPVFVRFSTVAGGAGSVDTPRDVRGFAVKFYTSEGVWDLVGNNIPVFFIQDAIKFPDLIHSAKMEADRGYPQAATAHDTFWDFISLMPEATHMIMWADVRPHHCRAACVTMEGFGIHTFRLVNASGQERDLREVSLEAQIWRRSRQIWDEDGEDRRAPTQISSAATCSNRLERGDYPEWELGIQAFDQEFADGLPYRRARSHQDHPRRSRCRSRIIGTHGARSLSRQFLRRNRTGGVLPRPISCPA